MADMRLPRKPVKPNTKALLKQIEGIDLTGIDDLEIVFNGRPFKFSGETEIREVIADGLYRKMWGKFGKQEKEYLELCEELIKGEIASREEQ